MNSDNTWMMMTYYCPTHGSGEKCEPLQLTREEIKKFRKTYKFSKRMKD
tara:strand:- start:338 stop:484 length:147 start_codon:yes stop_codon:yes gene_type:complete